MACAPSNDCAPSFPRKTEPATRMGGESRTRKQFAHLGRSSLKRATRSHRLMVALRHSRAVGNLGRKNSLPTWADSSRERATKVAPSNGCIQGLSRSWDLFARLGIRRPQSRQRSRHPIDCATRLPLVCNRFPCPYASQSQGLAWGKEYIVSE